MNYLKQLVVTVMRLKIQMKNQYIKMNYLKQLVVTTVISCCIFPVSAANKYEQGYSWSDYHRCKNIYGSYRPIGHAWERHYVCISRKNSRAILFDARTGIGLPPSPARPHVVPAVPTAAPVTAPKTSEPQLPPTSLKLDGTLGLT